MNRWVRLSAAVVSMAMIGNLQYAWTMCVQPIMSANHWKLSETQWGFTIFISSMTWTMPLSGWLIDRMGPRVFMTIAALLCGIGWSSLGNPQPLSHFYAWYAVAGIGNAFVYCCCTSLGLKWFPDKRGIASGLIAAGYGSGACLFNPFFGYLIGVTDIHTTFVATGVVLGSVIVIAGQLLEYPAKGFLSVPVQNHRPSIRKQSEQFDSVEMLRTPQFYLLFVMMLMVSVGGLMATAQVAPIARSFGISSTALAAALFLNPLSNGLSRLLWGWISDSFGRERSMALAFLLQAVFLSSLVILGLRGDVWFVVTMMLVFLTWGEIYVLFPAMLADVFGARNAASNYSILYVTKGLASILAGGLAAVMYERTVSWDVAIYGSALLAVSAAVAALGLRRMPLPRKGKAPLPNWNWQESAGDILPELCGSQRKARKPV